MKLIPVNWQLACTVVVWVACVLLSDCAWSQQIKLALPSGHEGFTRNAIWSSDNRLIATSGDDETVKVWDSQTGVLLLDLKDDGWKLQFSPDGRQLLTFASGAIRVWQLSTGQLIRKFNAAENTYTIDNSTTYSSASFTSSTFSPDGLRLLSSSHYSHYEIDTTVVWNVASGKELFRLPMVKEGVFSPVGTHIAGFAAGADTLTVWNADSGKHLFTLRGHTGAVTGVQFSPNGQQLLSFAADNTIRIWNSTTGNVEQLLQPFEANATLRSAQFSPDGKRVLAIVSNGRAYQWLVKSGQPLALLQPLTADATASYSPDGQSIVTLGDEKVRLWDTQSGAVRFTLQDPDALTPTEGMDNVSVQFSKDGYRLLTSPNRYYKTAQIWDTRTGTLLADMHHPTYAANTPLRSPDGRTLAVLTEGVLNLWDIPTATLRPAWQGHSPRRVETCAYSPDGRWLVNIVGGDIEFWDAQSGALNRQLKLGSSAGINVQQLLLSPDNAYIITTSPEDTAAYVWNATTGQLHFLLPATRFISQITFSADSKLLHWLSDTEITSEIWNVSSGKIISKIQHRGSGQFAPFDSDIQFSPNGRQLVARANNAGVDDGRLKWWNTTTGELLKPTKPNTESNLYKGRLRIAYHTFTSQPAYEFSPNGNYFLTLDTLGARVWDTNTGRQAASFFRRNTASIARRETTWSHFSADSKLVITLYNDRIIQVWDIATQRLIRQAAPFAEWVGDLIGVDSNLTYGVARGSNAETCRIVKLTAESPSYALMILDADNYLVHDAHYRYDGTAAARKLLNLTCGLEVIGLDQLKDQLWVPGLAHRLARGETINAPTIEQLDLCGLTPEVEPLNPPTERKKRPRNYRYRIHPRRGGLSELVLAVNGIEVHRYQPRQLRAVGADYELRVPTTELAHYFVAGQANPVTITAYTAQNNIASRGVELVQQPTAAAVLPNLYAVVVGVSDYKEEALDLKYAAKDAHDLGRTLGACARRLLNQDGKEHVFIHELSTGPDRESLPEKQAIKTALDKISQQATANDILLLFFAGHGVTAGPDKRFYFLTADASPASATEAAASVGISTQELSAWLRPSQLKAQKRVLIFDACQSGQAINDFVKLGGGNDPQYLAARNDDAGQRIKAVDKLNEQSGMFIFSASGTTQSAYEMGRYSQGLLTYALLRAIKEQPDILEDGRYLSVARWFAAADRGVQDLARASGQRQQPQLVSTTNFNLGEVDATVRGSIKLETEKPMFAASNFQNSDPALLDDDLDLSTLLDGQFQEISARGGEAPLVFTDNSAGMAEAYSLLGRYSVQGTTVRVRVSIRQNRRVVAQFEARGTNEAIEQLVADIARQASERVQTLK